MEFRKHRDQAKEKGERDDFVMNSFKGTVSRKDKRYFVSWPWREENESHFPENFGLSLGRSKSLSKRLEKKKTMKIENTTFLIMQLSHLKRPLQKSELCTMHQSK